MTLPVDETQEVLPANEAVPEKVDFAKYEQDRITALKTPTTPSSDTDTKPTEEKLPQGENNSLGTPTPADSKGGKTDAQDGGNNPTDTSKANDGEGKSEPFNDGKLPKGIKLRIERANIAKQKVEAENDQLKKELATLKSGSVNKDAPKEEKKPDPADAGSGEKTYDYPDEADYKTDTQAGKDSFRKDIDAWLDGVALTGGKYAKKAPDADTKTEPKPDEKAPADDKSKEDQEFAQLIADYFKLLDTDDDDDQLRDKFTKAADKHEIHASKVMIKWLYEKDDELLVSKAFIKTPKLSRNITAKPASEHLNLMNDLLTRLKTKESVPVKAIDENKRSINSNAPVVQSIVGTGKTNDNSNVGLSPEDYQRKRMSQDRNI